MARGDYTFSRLDSRGETIWTRVLPQSSDAAAIEEARLMLQSQAALPNGAAPLEIRVGRGGEDRAPTWLGAWRMDGGPRWTPE